MSGIPVRAARSVCVNINGDRLSHQKGGETFAEESQADITARGLEGGQATRCEELNESGEERSCIRRVSSTAQKEEIARQEAMMDSRYCSRSMGWRESIKKNLTRDALIFRR
jgi:hypothetical protein